MARTLSQPVSKALRDVMVIISAVFCGMFVYYGLQIPMPAGAVIVALGVNLLITGLICGRAMARGGDR